MSAKVAMPASSPPHHEPLPDDFTSSLEQVLLSYICEKDLNLELAAGLCNLSKRTLQRRLKEMGSHYSEVRDHTRFHAASWLLQNSGMTVTDIALQLGYSDVAHFARAFDGSGRS